MSVRPGRQIEELKRKVNERLIYRDRKHKEKVLSKNVDDLKDRLLINVMVPGIVGPLRLVVNHYDTVSRVIRASLKRYAREGRVPEIGFNVDAFLLYSADDGYDALNSKEVIGDCKGRNFVLCKKLKQPVIRVLRRVDIVSLKENCCKDRMIFKSVFKKMWKRSSSRVGIHGASSTENFGGHDECTSPVWIDQPSSTKI